MKKTASFLFILSLLGFGIPQTNPKIFIIGDSTMVNNDNNNDRKE
jgi:hypothetical protein